MERRRDPNDFKMYTYDEFCLFYGQKQGEKLWKKASSPTHQYRVGMKVRALTKLAGDRDQVVNQGDIGTVTALPGPGSVVEHGAVAEVLIRGVRFDAQPAMIEPADRINKNNHHNKGEEGAFKLTLNFSEEKRKLEALRAATYVMHQFNTVTISITPSTGVCTLIGNNKSSCKAAATCLNEYVDKMTREANAIIPSTFVSNNNCFLLASNETKTLGIKRLWKQFGIPDHRIINSWQICNNQLNEKFRETECFPGNMIIAWHGTGMLFNTFIHQVRQSHY